MAYLQALQAVQPGLAGHLRAWVSENRGFLLGLVLAIPGLMLLYRLMEWLETPVGAVVFTVLMVASIVIPLVLLLALHIRQRRSVLEKPTAAPLREEASQPTDHPVRRARVEAHASEHSGG